MLIPPQEPGTPPPTCLPPDIHSSSHIWMPHLIPCSQISIEPSKHHESKQGLQMFIIADVHSPWSHVNSANPRRDYTISPSRVSTISPSWASIVSTRRASMCSSSMEASKWHQPQPEPPSAGPATVKTYPGVKFCDPPWAKQSLCHSPSSSCYWWNITRCQILSPLPMASTIFQPVGYHPSCQVVPFYSVYPLLIVSPVCADTTAHGVVPPVVPPSSTGPIQDLHRSIQEGAGQVCTLLLTTWSLTCSVSGSPS